MKTREEEENKETPRENGARDTNMQTIPQGLLHSEPGMEI